MNLILFRDSDVWEAEGERFVSITDKPRLSHLSNVLKVELGKTLKVGIVNSTKDEATVVALQPGRTDLRLSAAFHSPQPPPQPVVDLVVGLPRPQSLDKLLQYCASMGVTRIHLVCSSRVELSYLSSHVVRPENIERSLLLGMEQGVSTFMPQVNLFRSFGALERELQRDPACLRLIAHPYTSDTLGSLGVARHCHGPVMVAIGPEGGWLDQEIENYNQLGFRPFNIGDRILRAEVAAVAILSQLQLLLSDSTLRGGLPPATRTAPTGELP